LKATYARDIVDESDENFSPRFELIYTMGAQRPIEASPGRWLLVEQVLELARPLVAAHFPSSIETVLGIPSAFPRTRILRDDVAHVLVRLLATKSCNEGLRGFPIIRQPSVKLSSHTSRKAIFVNKRPTWLRKMLRFLGQAVCIFLFFVVSSLTGY
jgi:hypothetical protein